MFIGRSAQAILSYPALKHNVDLIQKRAGKASMVAMIKANAYGHGIRQVARRLAHHCEILGVVSIDEAMIVRSVGVNTPILIIEGPASLEELYESGNRGYRVVIHSQEQLAWLQAYRGPAISVWLMIDTGMGHLGFSVTNAVQIYQVLKSAHQVASVVLMSHFSCADTPNHDLHHQQIQNFSQLSKQIDCKQSLTNSAGLFHSPSQHYDFIRPGLSLYGYVNGYENHGLSPVMTLQSKIIAIREFLAGDSIGYGAIFKCTAPMRVAIIAIGYGDGYPLCNHDGFPVVIHNQVFYSVGKISMDRLVVDITHADVDLSVGDWAVLWGEKNPLEQIAKLASRSVYELLTGVQNRVKFIWQD